MRLNRGNATRPSTEGAKWCTLGLRCPTGGEGFLRREAPAPGTERREVFTVPPGKTSAYGRFRGWGTARQCAHAQLDCLEGRKHGELVLAEQELGPRLVAMRG